MRSGPYLSLLFQGSKEATLREPLTVNGMKRGGLNCASHRKRMGAWNCGAKHVVGGSYVLRLKERELLMGLFSLYSCVFCLAREGERVGGGRKKTRQRRTGGALPLLLLRARFARLWLWLWNGETERDPRCNRGRRRLHEAAPYVPAMRSLLGVPDISRG
ncbi:hypothetical protein BHE74_00005384 [Ensete ventricosum]|nr:hypothetical protein BHE74_00005384 [Ensete ventricosum]